MLERVNLRALRFVHRDICSSYEELLQKDHSTSLHLRRTKLLAIEVFKILLGERPSYLSNLISPKCNSHYNFRYTNLLNIPRFKSKVGKLSFRYQAAKIWDDLPQEMRDATDFKSFNRLLTLWSGEGCKCAMCKFTP